MSSCPFPAPLPNNGLAKSLEEAKQQFKQRYEEMKAQRVRPFCDDVIEAKTEDEAIEIASKEFKVAPNRLIAKPTK
jgi:hypothetical protein